MEAFFFILGMGGGICLTLLVFTLKFVDKNDDRR